MSYLADQDRILFRKILRLSLGVYSLLGLVLTVTQLPDLKNLDMPQVPNRIAKLILEPPELLPQPTVKIDEPKNQTVPEPEKKIPKPQKKNPPAKVKNKPKPKPVEKPAPKKEISETSSKTNREIVQKSGLLSALSAEESTGVLNELMVDRRFDEALSEVNVVSAESGKKKSHMPLEPARHLKQKGLANEKMTSLSDLQKTEKIQLHEREVVTVTEIAPKADGTGERGHGLGQDVGLRIKGRGSEQAEIDYDAIARVVDKYKGGLVYLYNKELRTKPTLKGTVTVEFSIDETGRVADARVVKSTMDHAPLEKALAKRIRMWKFPKLYTGIIVLTYPFVFFPV